MAERSLKDQNRIGLFLVVTANIVALYFIAAANSLIDANWLEAGKALGKILPASLGGALVGVLNAQVDATVKARIVFMRWNDPLPGSRAFTKYGPKDDRVDMGALKKRLGELPVSPKEQNVIWYRLYREVADKPAIRHANKEYLFTRDYHVLAVGIFILFGVGSIWAIADPLTRTLYAVGLLLQTILTGQAARNNGYRLVCSVLALSTPLVPPSAKQRKIARSTQTDAPPG